MLEEKTEGKSCMLKHKQYSLKCQTVYLSAVVYQKFLSLNCCIVVEEEVEKEKATEYSFLQVVHTWIYPMFI